MTQSVRELRFEFEEQLSRIEFRGSRHASLFLARFHCLSVGVAGREDLSSLMSSFPSDFDVSNFFLRVKNVP